MKKIYFLTVMLAFLIVTPAQAWNLPIYRFATDELILNVEIEPDMTVADVKNLMAPVHIDWATHDLVTGQGVLPNSLDANTLVVRDQMTDQPEPFNTVYVRAKESVSKEKERENLSPKNRGSLRELREHQKMHKSISQQLNPIARALGVADGDNKAILVAIEKLQKQIKSDVEEKQRFEKAITNLQKRLKNEAESAHEWRNEVRRCDRALREIRELLAIEQSQNRDEVLANIKEKITTLKAESEKHKKGASNEKD